MTTTEPSRVGAVLLAAGASRGLGHPKQLVVYEGQTLIRRAAEQLVASGVDPIIVVLGAVVDECRRELEGLPVAICINDKWAVGISSSIKAGIRKLVEIEPAISAVMIALCDQPFVGADDYKLLISEYAVSRSAVTAAAYGVVGVPAVFARTMFDNLVALTNDEGARHLIRLNLDKTKTVEMPSAAFDVDTRADEESLRVAT